MWIKKILSVFKVLEESSTMRALLIRLSRCRTRMKPETRNGLDGFAVLFVITLFFSPGAIGA